MSCESKLCTNIISSKCNSCPLTTFYCDLHGLEHKNHYNHDVHVLENEVTEILISRVIKSKIKDCISKISNDTKLIISGLNQISVSTIKKLKDLNKNLKSLGEFKDLRFNKNRVIFLENQVKSVTESVNIEYENDIFTVFDEINRKNQELEKEISLLKKINKFEGFNNCKYFSGFNNLNLEDKKFVVSKNWNYIKFDLAEQLLLSNDGKFLFECEYYLGISQADINVQCIQYVKHTKVRTTHLRL